MQSWVIALCILKQHIVRPYRRSKVGIKLFRKILSIISNKVGGESEPNICESYNVMVKTTEIPKCHRTTISQINARLTATKIPMYQDHVIQENVSIRAITESWLKDD